jgi:hypothetical protein
VNEPGESFWEIPGKRKFNGDMPWVELIPLHPPVIIANKPSHPKWRINLHFDAVLLVVAALFIFKEWDVGPGRHPNKQGPASRWG